MPKYDPIIAELERELANVLALWEGVGMRRVRATEHPAGGTPSDVTQRYADGLRTAADALNKVVAALKMAE